MQRHFTRLADLTTDQFDIEQGAVQAYQLARVQYHSVRSNCYNPPAQASYLTQIGPIQAKESQNRPQQIKITTAAESIQVDDDSGDQSFSFLVLRRLPIDAAVVFRQQSAGRSSSGSETIEVMKVAVAAAATESRPRDNQLRCFSLKTRLVDRYRQVKMIVL